MSSMFQALEKEFISLGNDLEQAEGKFDPSFKERSEQIAKKIAELSTTKENLVFLAPFIPAFNLIRRILQQPPLEMPKPDLNKELVIIEEMIKQTKAITPDHLVNLMQKWNSIYELFLICSPFLQNTPEFAPFVQRLSDAKKSHHCL